MKHFKNILIFILIDFIILWFYVKNMGFDPSGAIVIILILPVIFFTNLLVAAVLYVLKKDYFSKLFLLNSVLSSIMFFFLFKYEMNRNMDKVVEIWEFKKSDTTFILYRSKVSEDFHLDYSLDPGSSSGYIDGRWEETKNGFTLTVDDSTKYFLISNLLIGFRKPTDTILLTKYNR